MKKVVCYYLMVLMVSILLIGCSKSSFDYAKEEARFNDLLRPAQVVVAMPKDKFGKCVIQVKDANGEYDGFIGKFVCDYKVGDIIK